MNRDFCKILRKVVDVAETFQSVDKDQREGDCRGIGRRGKETSGKPAKES
jgi:hypothetical protein